MQRFTVYLLLALLAPTAALAGGYGQALSPLLEGEFALQQGEVANAAQAYVRAADLGNDPVVAERAVQVALNAQDAALAAHALARWTALAPDDVGLELGRLRLALLEGDEVAARASLETLLAGENGWRQAVAALATTVRRETSSRLLEVLLEEERLPATMDAWLAFGGVALRLEDKSLYARLAQAAAQRFPDEPGALVWQAEEALARGDAETARRTLDVALALPELTPSERLSLAANLNALGDPGAAAKALESAGDDDRVLTSRAAYLTRSGNDADLAALYAEAVAKTPERGASAARLMLLGQLAEMQNDAVAALAWYRQIPGGLQREQAQLRIAVLLDKTGEKGAALDLLREVQASDSEWGDIVRDAYLIEAEMARGRDDDVAELSALDRGLAIFEDDAMLRYGRALAYERVDRVDEAVADLRTLVAAEPEEADFLNALGYTLVDRTQALEEGLSLIEKAVALKPDAPAILDSLGWALHRLGRDAEALPHLQRAFEMQRDAEIGSHLATVLAALGQVGEARSILRLAQEIDPENRSLRRAMQALSIEAGGE